VKHLLILLSILLLTSPLSVQSKKQTVLYQYKTYSGFIWKSIGNKKVQPKYEGEITNGKPNGQGTQTCPDEMKYVGEWKDGKPWNLISYYKDGNIELKIVNGEIQ